MTGSIDCLNCGGDLDGAGKSRGLCRGCYSRIYKSGSLDALFPKLAAPDPEPPGRPPWFDAPPAVDVSWHGEAVCPQTDPESFFPEKGGSTREAKAICRTCPVRMECLDYAVDHDERFGIWGGMSERERRRLKRLDKASA